MIQDRLNRLREQMRIRGIGVYLVPTSDFHNSEYVGEYFKARKFITGFTGSAGIAVITMEEARLWTDGRYFVQAAGELEGSSVILMKMGEEGVPTVNEYLESILQEDMTIGFDGRVVSAAWGRQLLDLAGKHGAFLYGEEDLVDLIWEDRPPLSKEPVMLFEKKYTGMETAEKLADIRKVMEEKGADVHLVSSLYDIAWILNVRGRDISYVPVVLSFLSVTADSCTWFVQTEALCDAVRAYMAENNIAICSYGEFYSYVSGIGKGQKVLMDPSVINYVTVNKLDPSVEIIESTDPSTLMKAVKNETELKNTREAHRKDAIAMIHFMYWLKTNIGKLDMTEISASDHLAALRAEQDNFMDLSFETICGYADHGAIVHYSATEESDAVLRPEGLLLVDSGGHYLEGTTDITRTFALGPVTEEMRADFTRVCRSNLNLAAARFKHGCTGMNLDIIAREPFWEAGLDYNHGTGHGVGNVLNVHEGPNGFRWQQSPGRSEGSVLEEGMITTDEPGIYIEGKYGIRTENELICRKGEKNSYGQFMYFENITYVPIDLDALAPDQMTPVERDRLNQYHAMVWEKMSPYFAGDELEFLKKYTRAV